MTKLVFALLAVLLAAAGAPTASAQSAAGPDAYAFFESLDAAGCVSTSVSVAVYSDARTAEVWFQQYDSCALAPGEEAPPVVRESSGTGSVSVRIGSTLDVARLRAAVPVVDRITGRAYTVAIDLTWRGVGEAEQTQATDCAARTRVTTTTRYASASGTVVAEGTNLSPSASTDGYLTRARSARIRC